MKLDVPFIVNKANDCGPISLLMILEYFGERITYEELKEMCLPDKSGITFTLGMARAAAMLGYRVEFYSKVLGFNAEAFDNDFYRAHGDGIEHAKAKIERLTNDCEQHDALLQERSLTVKEILAKVNENCVALALVNWNVIVGREGFHGHFMPIVGYDGEFVHFHQPGPKDPEPYFAITHDLFDKARRSVGTDEDIIFIGRKKSNAD